MQNNTYLVPNGVILFFTHKKREYSRYPKQNKMYLKENIGTCECCWFLFAIYVFCCSVNHRQLDDQAHLGEVALDKLVLHSLNLLLMMRMTTILLTDVPSASMTSSTLKNCHVNTSSVRNAWMQWRQHQSPTSVPFAECRLRWLREHSLKVEE